MISSANDLLREQMQRAQLNAQSLPNALSFPGASTCAATAASDQQNAHEDLPGYATQGKQATQYQFYRQDFAAYNLSCLHDPQQSHLVQLLDDTDDAPRSRLLQSRKRSPAQRRLRTRTIRVCRRRELAYSAQDINDADSTTSQCALVMPTFKKSFNVRQQDPFIPLHTSRGMIPLHLYRGDYYHFTIPLDSTDVTVTQSRRTKERGIRLEWRILWSFLSNKNDYKLRRIFRGMKLGILGEPTTQVIGWFLPTPTRPDEQELTEHETFAGATPVLRSAIQMAQLPEPSLARSATHDSARACEPLSLEADLNRPAILGNLILADAELSEQLVPGWQGSATDDERDPTLDLIREMATTSFVALYFRVVLADTMHEKVAKYTQDGASLGRGMLC
jgi:hypothetical protein